MEMDYTGIRELNLIMLEDTLNREIPEYYKEEIILEIGRNIKEARKADNKYEKTMYRHFALALWAFASTTNLLNVKQCDGIRRQILTGTF